MVVVVVVGFMAVAVPMVVLVDVLVLLPDVVPTAGRVAVHMALVGRARREALPQARQPAA